VATHRSVNTLALHFYTDGKLTPFKRLVSERKALYKQPWELQREEWIMERILHIRIVEARDLLAKDSNGLSDPYV